MSRAPLGEMIIELSLDSTDFGKSLKSSRNEVRYWASSMKAQMRAAENAGKTMDKMKFNVEGLTKTIEAQKKVVERLKKSYDGSFVDGKATANTERYARQLREAEAQLMTYQGQLKQATYEMEKFRVKTEGITGAVYKAGERLDQTGSKLKSFGEGMSNIGDKLSMSVTAPIVAAAGYAVKAASDYETALTGVRKTNDEIVDANGRVIYSYEDLSNGIRNLSKEIPVSAVELANLAEISGQLGIQTDKVVEFTEVVSKMGVATNLSGEEAAEGMAKFLNVTGSGTETVENLASSIVTLGNNMATTEKDILNMAQGWASTGALVGLADDKIIAISATLSSMGVEAEAGSSSMQRLFTNMNTAVHNAGSELEAFAKVAGVTATEFAQAWAKDPAEALRMFLEGLNGVHESGGNANAVLKELGINSVRDVNAVLSLSQGHEQLAEALGLSAEAYAEGTALSKEAETAYETFANKLRIFRNKVEDVAIELGGPLLDALTSALDAAEPWIDTAAEMAKTFAELDEEQQRNILKWVALAAALGPVLSVGGRVVDMFGSLLQGIGKISKKLVDMYAEKAGKKAMEEIGEASINSADDVVASATKGGAASSLFSNPWILGSAGVVAAIAGIGWAIRHDATEPQRAHEEAVKKTDGAYQEWFDGVVEGNEKIVEMNENAIAGAYETAEAYKEVAQSIREQNSDINKMNEATFGDWATNLTGARWSWVSADVNQDGQVQNYRMENLTPSLKDFGLAKEEIKALQQEVENYQIQIGNSFADIANTFANQGVVTAEWANAHMTTFQNVVESTKSRLEEMRQAQIESVEGNQFYSPEQRERMIKEINSTYDAQIEAIEKAENTIKEILKNASDENRALTDEEVLHMMEAYQQLAESTGQSLSEIDGVAELVGNNLSAFTTQAGLEALETAGIIDQSVVDAVANAETSKEKITLLNEAIEEYSNLTPEAKEFQTNANEVKAELEGLGFTVHEVNGQTVVIPTNTNSKLTQDQVERLGLKAVTVNGTTVYIPSSTNSKDSERLVKNLEAGAKNADGTKVNIPSRTNADETRRKVERAKSAATNKTFTITGIVRWWQGSRLNPSNWARGTNYHTGGLAIVNDQAGPYFREYIQLPSGAGFIPHGRNVMLDLPRGTKVLKAADTIKKFGNIPQYAQGIGDISIHSPVFQNMDKAKEVVSNNQSLEIHYVHLLKEIVTRLEDVRFELTDFKALYNPKTEVVLDTDNLVRKTKNKFQVALKRDEAFGRRSR